MTRHFQLSCPSHIWAVLHQQCIHLRFGAGIFQGDGSMVISHVLLPLPLSPNTDPSITFHWCCDDEEGSGKNKKNIRKVFYVVNYNFYVKFDFSGGQIFDTFVFGLSYLFMEVTMADDPFIASKGDHIEYPLVTFPPPSWSFLPLQWRRDSDRNQNKVDIEVNKLICSRSGHDPGCHYQSDLTEFVW